MSPKRRILLVDDDPGVLKMYGKRLEVAGYEVVRAADGEDALAKIEQHAPALIILDIMMPRLNGYEVCTKLKQDPATRAIPIIMFTAKGRPQEHVVGLMFGADSYVSKSCKAQVLLDQVQTLLGQNPTV